MPVYALLKSRRKQMMSLVIVFSLFFFYKSSGWYFLLLVATSFIDRWVAQFIEFRKQELHRAAYRAHGVDGVVAERVVAFFKYC